MQHVAPFLLLSADKILPTLAITRLWAGKAVALEFETGKEEIRWWRGRDVRQVRRVSCQPAEHLLKENFQQFRAIHPSPSKATNSSAHQKRYRSERWPVASLLRIRQFRRVD